MKQRQEVGFMYNWAIGQWKASALSISFISLGQWRMWEITFDQNYTSLCE